MQVKWYWLSAPGIIFHEALFGDFGNYLDQVIFSDRSFI